MAKHRTPNPYRQRKIESANMTNPYGKMKRVRRIHRKGKAHADLFGGKNTALNHSHMAHRGRSRHVYGGSISGHRDWTVHGKFRPNGRAATRRIYASHMTGEFRGTHRNTSISRGGKK